MKILVLGVGCPKCKMLENRALEAAKKMNLEDDSVEKITDIMRIASFGITSTPALIVNGKLKMSGHVPSVEKIIEFIKEEL